MVVSSFRACTGDISRTENGTQLSTLLRLASIRAGATENRKCQQASLFVFVCSPFSILLRWMKEMAGYSSFSVYQTDLHWLSQFSFAK
jgi:hypothetical protein